MRRTAASVLLLVLAVFPAASQASGAPTLTEYEIPTSDLKPASIVGGPDGKLWFTVAAKPGVETVSTAGVFSPLLTTGITNPTQGIMVGSDGNLWFTEPKSRIGKVTTLGVATEYVVEGEPVELAPDPEGGALWYTNDAAPDSIARLSLSTGKSKEYSVGLTANSKPGGIAAGQDGNLWFTETVGSGAIGRITPTGTITEFTAGLTANSKLGEITAGPEDSMWFTEQANPGAIGRIERTGAIAEYRTGLTANSQPYGIATADDGSVYFTERAAPGRIGRITASGLVTEYATPSTGSQPEGIAEGPDGNMWFTELGNHGKIGRITVAPGVSEGAVSSVAERWAKVTAEVRPNSQATTYLIEYGPTAGYGHATATAAAGEGSAAETVPGLLEGLSPFTVYHYRVVATNASGTTYGPDTTVQTAAPPLPLTESPAGVSTSSAVLRGSVTPNGRPTTYSFEWGTTTGYGSHAPAGEESAGSGTSAVAVEAPITGLTPGATYHYRLVATNCGGCEEGTLHGADQTFTAAPLPIATTGMAEVPGPTAAIVAGIVGPSGASTTYHFDYGTSTAYGFTAPKPDAAAGSDNTLHGVSQALTGLTPGTTYYYRVVATNCGGCAAGTVPGGAATFTTPGLPPLPGALGTPPLLQAAPNEPHAAVLGRMAVAEPIRGNVMMRWGGREQQLGSSEGVPIGALVDVTHGMVQLTAALPGGRTQTVTVWGGRFILHQSLAAHGLAELALAGPLGCDNANAHRATVAGRRAPSRGLWAHDNHGRFSTRGQNSVATVRGTEWETLDTCHGTLTVVRQGAVVVRDLRRHRSVVVRAGHRYLAKR